MSNNATSTTPAVWVFEFATLPEIIRGASVVSQLSSAESVNLAGNNSNTAAMCGKGLASTLALLAFGSISYKSNPYAGLKTAKGKALAACWGTVPHVRLKPGATMTRGDLETWFNAVVTEATKALPAKAAKASPKAKAPATVTMPDTTASQPKSERKPHAVALMTGAMHDEALQAGIRADYVETNARLEREGLERAVIDAKARQEAERAAPVMLKAAAKRQSRDFAARKIRAMRATIREQAATIEALRAELAASMASATVSKAARKPRAKQAA